MDRRTFLTGVAAGLAAGAARRTVRADTALPLHSSQSPPSLAALAFTPLPLGSIRPQGWLGRQLRLQADGLSGHLDQFWPDIAEASGSAAAPKAGSAPRTGSTARSRSRGFSTMRRLKARITDRVDYIVEHQRPDGWYSPYPTDAVAKRYDMWAILLANKVLAQYHEATGDARVLDAVARSLRAMDEGLDRTPLYDWGKFRWFEGLVPVFTCTSRGRALAARSRA